MMQRERSDVYIIPPNFAKEGTLFSGRIEGRNAFEAAVLFIVLFRILFFIDVSIKLRIYIGIIVILPLTILAVVGVNGESLLCFYPKELFYDPCHRLCAGIFGITFHWKTAAPFAR